MRHITLEFFDSPLTLSKVLVSLTFSWLTQRVTDLYTKDLQRGLVVHNAKEIVNIKTLHLHFSTRDINKTMFLVLKRKHVVPFPQDERFIRVIYIFFLFVVCCPLFVPLGPGKYNYTVICSSHSLHALRAAKESLNFL